MFEDAYLKTLVGFILGSIFGSFINVCATRIPLGKSVIHPPSSCPQCNVRIKWFHNLPIFSWLMLRGKAMCCNFEIPFRYIGVEFLTALLFGFFFYQYSLFGSESRLLVSLAFGFLMIVIIVIDLETMIIPDRFSMGGALLGLVCSAYFPLLHGFSSDPLFPERLSSVMTSLLGMIISSSVLFWIGAFAEKLMKQEALGQGDIKLLGCVGAFCGWEGGLFTIFAGALLGSIIMISFMLVSKYLKLNKKNRRVEVGWGLEIPFGPFLGMAALAYFLGLHLYVDTWFEKTRLNFIHLFSFV